MHMSLAGMDAGALPTSCTLEIKTRCYKHIIRFEGTNNNVQRSIHSKQEHFKEQL